MSTFEDPALDIAVVIFFNATAAIKMRTWDGGGQSCGCLLDGNSYYCVRVSLTTEITFAELGLNIRELCAPIGERGTLSPYNLATAKPATPTTHVQGHHFT